MRIVNIILRYAYLSALWFGGAMVTASLASLYLAGTYGSTSLNLTNSLIAVTALALLGGMATTAAGWLAYRRALVALSHTTPRVETRGAAIAEIG